MRKAALVVLGVVVLATGLTLWRWTHTPYGRMDLGPAILTRMMPADAMDLTPEGRAAANEWTARLMGAAPPGLTIRDLEFAGPTELLPARVYIPDHDAPLGVVAWLHGGGFWMGDELEKWDGPCGRLAAGADVIVASLGYRLAPEHPYPAAVADTWAGLQWVAAHASEWGAAPDRLAVAGGSAGGNLAAVLAQRARDEGGPELKLQILTVPTLNAGGEPTESMRRFSSGFGLDGIEKMRRAYFANPAATRHPWASPLLASRFEGLAPAVIHTAQFDPLRDEGELYAARLEAAGVPVELRRFDGAIHGFLGSPATMAEAERLVAAAARSAIGGESSP
ncbi:MAG: alpha/beta hydrolase [Deltaproteobacteria bacterium]|nr:alpha/beta hydrolase [Deltaproteobacteria bacterium]